MQFAINDKSIKYSKVSGKKALTTNVYVALKMQTTFGLGL